MQFKDKLKIYAYRTFIFNCISYLFAVGFLLYATYTAICLRSAWYAFLVGFYSILLIMRFIILYSTYKNLKFPHHDKYAYYLKLYMAYGVIFILITLFIGITFLTTEFKIYKSHQLKISMLVFSGYAIIKFLFALYNYIKAYKKTTYIDKNFTKFVNY